MKNKLISDESTRIGMHETHHEINFDPVMGAVPILDENDLTDAGYLLDKRELEALTSWIYFEPLQFR